MSTTNNGVINQKSWYSHLNLNFDLYLGPSHTVLAQSSIFYDDFLPLMKKVMDRASCFITFDLELWSWHWSLLDGFEALYFEHAYQVSNNSDLRWPWVITLYVPSLSDVFILVDLGSIIFNFFSFHHNFISVKYLFI